MSINISQFRGLLRASLACAAIGFAFSLAGSPAQATVLPGTFLGLGHAVFALAETGTVNAALSSAAAAACPCQGTNGKLVSHTASALNDGSLVTSGVSSATAFSTKSAATASTEETSTIANLSLFGGLITADALKADASATASATALAASTAGTSFTNLVIAGQPVDPNIAPNTVIGLPGIGSVTVNYTRLTQNKTEIQQIVQVLRISVTAANTFGIPAGATLVVGHAMAGYNKTPLTYVYAGNAAVTNVTGDAGSALEETLGQGAAVSIPTCSTDGKTESLAIAATSVGTLISLEGGATTAFAGPVSAGAQTKTTATVASLSLLGGLIGADSITSVAESSIAGGVTTADTNGSQFTNLTVAGAPIDQNVAPNTSIDLPGIGTVVVNEQTITNQGYVTINGLHVFVTVSNLLGLPVGTEIRVATATAFTK